MVVYQFLGSIRLQVKEWKEEETTGEKIVESRNYDQTCETGFDQVNFDKSNKIKRYEMLPSALWVILLSAWYFL